MLNAIFVGLAMIGGYVVVGCVLSAWMMIFHDRSGNSGRYGKHWTDESDD